MTASASPTSDLPSLAYLREALSYTPSTGALTWLVRPEHHFARVRAARRWNTIYSGKPAGSLKVDGYVCVKVNYRLFKAHRIAFALFHGIDLVDLPSEIDHRNGTRSDNRSDNIRPATHVENGRNRQVNRNNKIGVKGVYWNVREKRFFARICINNKLKHLGSFHTVEEASAAYQAAAELHFGEFMRAAA